MICPKCQYQRRDTDDPLIPDYQCPACGVIYAKFLKQINGIPGKDIKEIDAPFIDLRKPIELNAKVATMLAVVVAIFSISYLMNSQNHEIQTENRLELSDTTQNIEKPQRQPEPIPRLPTAAPSIIKPPGVPPTIGMFSIDEIQNAYESNTIAADLKFKGNRMKLTGTVVDINTDILGNPYLVMKNAKNAFARPQLTFNKSDMAALSKISKGQYLMAICTGDGDVAKIAMFKDCTFP